MNVFFNFAMAQPAGGQEVNPLMAYLPIIIIVFIFYFMIYRPNKRRQTERQTMLTDLKKGNKVITTGGIHGTIVNIKDQVLTIKIADNVKIDVSKSCIAGVKGTANND